MLVALVANRENETNARIVRAGGEGWLSVTPAEACGGCVPATSPSAGWTSSPASTESTAASGRSASWRRE